MINQNTDLRVSLIGCGRWGRNLARVLSRLGNLDRIIDPAGEQLKPYADELGVRLVDKIDSAFDDDIHAVVIAAPAVDHFSLARRALLAGKPVFVEKPLALEIGEAEALAALAGDRGLTLMVGHLLQYHPAFVKLKDLVLAGVIGELRHITSHRLNPGAIRTEENALWSMAPHDFSMTLALAGALPTTVSTLPVQVVNADIPDQFFVQMRFSDLLTAQTSVTWLSPYKEHKLTVLGTTGALVFEDTASDPSRKLVLYRDYIDRSGSVPRFAKGEGESVEFPAGEPLELEMRAFLSACQGGEGNRTGPEEAIPVLELLRRASGALLA